MNEKYFLVRLAIIFGFLLSLIVTQIVSAACQVEFLGEAAQMFGSTPRGDFSSLSACEAYINSSPGFEKHNSRCVGCDTIRRGGSPSYSPDITTSQGMAAALFGSLLKGLMQELLAPVPSSAPQESQQKKLMREQEQKQKWKEYLAKVKEQMATSEKEYGRIRKDEFEKQKKSLVGDLKSRYAAAFGSEDKTGTSFRQLQQLQCSVYWELKAAEMTIQGDAKLAHRYGKYSAWAKEGIFTECPKMNVDVPDVPAPQFVGGLQQELYVFMLEETNQIIPVINDLQEKKKVLQENITSKQVEITTLKQKEGVADDKEKQEIDMLLLEANKLLADALEEDKKATDELNTAENKLKVLQEMNKLYAVEKNPSNEGITQ